MSFFMTNLAAVRAVSSTMAEQLEAHHVTHGEPVELGAFSIEPSRSGQPTVRYAGEDGSSYYLHSPYDPQREAEQFARQTMADRPKENLTVLFGMGLGYQALELARLIPAGERLMIYEPHWELLYLALCHQDLVPLFSRANLVLTSSTEVNGPLLASFNAAELAGFSGLRIVSNPAFDRLPGAQGYSTIADRLRYELMALGGNLQTLMVMGEMQQMNILLNFPEILDNPPFKNLIGRFDKRPAIIVSAGPSLEKNMNQLAELADRALIIAVDTATKPLLQAGIVPHVVVTGDPQEANARHLWDVDLPNTYLIAEPQSPVSAVARWTGPKFICSFHDNMMQWIDRMLGDRGRLRVWGSVAVMAYDCAVKLGADPIVFIGQDLSFPGGRTYTSGTYFETEEKQELTADSLRRRGDKLIDMTDIYGEPVQTNRQMFAYFNYLSDQFWQPEARERLIINATEGGILQGPRVKLATLETTIAEHMGDRWDVWGLLAEAHSQNGNLHISSLTAEVERMLANLRDAAEICRRGLEQVERTVVALGQPADSGAVEAAAHFKRMEELRLRLGRDRELSRMLEMANHAGIYAFTQGIQQLAREKDVPDAQLKLRHCYHYHTLYSSTAAAVSRLLPLFEHCRTALQQRAGRSMDVAAA